MSNAPQAPNSRSSRRRLAIVGLVALCAACLGWCGRSGHPGSDPTCGYTADLGEDPAEPAPVADSGSSGGVDTTAG
jgi:ferric-dicitrate binding protein FerR (iron transport regulator)